VQGRLAAVAQLASPLPSFISLENSRVLPFLSSIYRKLYHALSQRALARALACIQYALPVSSYTGTLSSVEYFMSIGVDPASDHAEIPLFFFLSYNSIARPHSERRNALPNDRGCGALIHTSRSVP
jgi:hypothetical protein